MANSTHKDDLIEEIKRSTVSIIFFIYYLMSLLHIIKLAEYNMYVGDNMMMMMIMMYVCVFSMVSHPSGFFLDCFMHNK